MLVQLICCLPSISLTLSLFLFSVSVSVFFFFFFVLIPFSPLAFLHVRKYNSVWLECRTPNNWCTLYDVLVHTILCTINNIETFQTLVESMKSHCCVGKCSIQKSSHIYQCLDLHQAILLWNAHNYFMLQIHSDSTYILHANLLNISIVFFSFTFPHEMAFNQVEFEFKLKDELDLREIFEFRVDFSIKNSLNRSKWLWIDLKIVGAKFKSNSIWSSK